MPIVLLPAHCVSLGSFQHHTKGNAITTPSADHLIPSSYQRHRKLWSLDPPEKDSGFVVNEEENLLRIERAELAEFLVMSFAESGDWNLELEIRIELKSREYWRELVDGAGPPSTSLSAFSWSNGPN